MPLGAIVLLDSTQPADVLEGWKQAARDFSRSSLVSVRLLTGDEAALTTLASHLASQTTLWTEQSLEEGSPPVPPMQAAPFVYKDDGHPDWGAMWTTFCELALHGGPPHRGPDDSVLAVVIPEATSTDSQPGSGAVAEIRRGIFETTGLYAERADPGWLAITCDSPRMAAWLCASIILENVDARCEGERLLVPADPSFALTDQVRSVVTVVAKTHHYWAAHMAATSTVEGTSPADPEAVREAGRAYRRLLTEWGWARMAHDTTVASRCHQEAHDLTLELSATAAGRVELEAALTDPDVWVRVAAAADVMRWAPEAARPVLDSIRETGGEGSMDAAFALMQYDAGRRI